jgi:hypothetical protein
MGEVMRTSRILARCVAVTLIVAGALGAGEKPKSESQAVIPVKVTLVFNEYDDEKKLSSLPYTMPVNAQAGPNFAHAARIRMGLRVPVLTNEGKDAQIQYQDIGTNIDCSVRPTGDGRFMASVIAQRMSVYSAVQGKQPVEWHPGDPVMADKPIFSQVRMDQELLLHDGQTLHAVAATDPISGHVIKVDVTLNVERQ